MASQRSLGNTPPPLRFTVCWGVQLSVALASRPSAHAGPEGLAGPSCGGGVSNSEGLRKALEPGDSRSPEQAFGGGNGFAALRLHALIMRIPTDAGLSFKVSWMEISAALRQHHSSPSFALGQNSPSLACVVARPAMRTATRVGMPRGKGQLLNRRGWLSLFR